MKLPISVLIPTYNRPNSIKRTLLSYLSFDTVPGQIVIVDQSEKNETKEIIEEIKNFSSSSDIIYCKLNTPSSTASRNVAMKLAGYDICIMSDDDIDIFEDTLLNVHNLFSDNNIALVAGVDVCRSQRSKDNILKYIAGFESFKNRNIGHVTQSVLGVYPRNIYEMTETQWAMGYFFAIRKKICEENQILWDEKLGSYAYAEDLDFTYRYCQIAKLHSLKCIISSKVKVKHLYSKEYRISSKLSIFKYVINREYLYYKWNSSPFRILSIRWTDFWMFVLMLLRRQNAYDIMKAMLICDFHRVQLRNGDMSFLEILK